MRKLVSDLAHFPQLRHLCGTPSLCFPVIYSVFQIYLCSKKGMAISRGYFNFAGFAKPIEQSCAAW
jgi:hypothetical protein